VLVRCESWDAKKLQIEFGWAGWQEPRLFARSVAGHQAPVRLKFKVREFSLRSAMFRSSFMLSAGRGRLALCDLAARLDARIRGLRECPML